MHTYYKALLSSARFVASGITLLLSLVACGGSDSTSEPSGQALTPTPTPSSTPSSSPTPPSPTPTNTSSPTPSESEVVSRFSDPVISGLRYETATQSGVTGSEGSFMHLEGEDITFKVGSITFPVFVAADSTYLFDLASTHILSDTAFKNVSRLLYSLDSDGNAENGIQIDDQAHVMAEGMSVNFESDTFDTDVANLVSTSGSVNTTLLPEDDVRNNILAYLDTDESCNRTSHKVGQVADLKTIHHLTAGRLRVLNDCTIEVTGFRYDGQGAGDVRFYDLEAGKSFGDNLSGRAYENDTFTFTVTPDELADLSRISLWCIPVGVNFGDGTFR